MTRRKTLKRLVVGIPFLVLYAIVLFPGVFAISIVFGAVDGAWQLLTSKRTRLTAVSGRLWDWNGSNARYALTGNGTGYELFP